MYGVRPIVTEDAVFPTWGCVVAASTGDIFHAVRAERTHDYG